MLMLVAQGAHAQAAANELGGDADAVVTARLSRVEHILAEDEEHTRTWWRSWIYVQSGLFAGNVGWGLLTFDDTGARAEHFLNAGGSLLGLLSLVVLRPPALRAGKTLDSLSDSTPLQRAMKLETAEALLAESAEAQSFGSGWAPYTGAFVVGSAIAGPLWFKYDRKLGATGSLVGSMVLTSIQVATLPTQALKERSGRTPPTQAPITKQVRHRIASTESIREARAPKVPRRALAPHRGLTLSLAPTTGGLLLAGRW